MASDNGHYEANDHNTLQCGRNDEKCFYGDRDNPGRRHFKIIGENHQQHFYLVFGFFAR